MPGPWVAVAMLSTPLSWSRSSVDLMVAVTHIVACGVLYGLSQYYTDYAGRLLLVMEVVTVVFHLFYALVMSNQRPSWMPDWAPQEKKQNLWKWLEYA